MFKSSALRLRLIRGVLVEVIRRVPGTLNVLQALEMELAGAAPGAHAGNSDGNYLEGCIENIPTVGWFCTYTPEEILMAAGFAPRRIPGTFQGIKFADAFLQSNLCPYVRSCLDGAFDGR